jgi:hypothetical protein
VACFGEIALIAGRRDAFGQPVDIAHGRIGNDLETARARTGTLMVRGAMVPLFAFPPGAERGAEPHLKTDDAGFIDTGFTCRVDPAAETLTVTGPPGGITAIGGYRLRAVEVEALVSSVDPTATIVALPSGLLAQKLAGSAIDNALINTELHKIGVNPLIAGAFRPRGNANAA